MAQRNPAQLTDDQLFQDWLRWIQRAYDEAVGQARRFRLFRLVHGVYQQNDHLQHTGGFLFQWMADNYVAASAMAFRRELDTQAGTENLIHLLREMRDHPSVISRARFRATWSETEPNNAWNANRAFNAYPHVEHADGPDQDHVDPDAVAADLVVLEEQDRVLEHVQTTVAHRGPELQGASVPTFAEFHAAIKAIGGVFRRYYTLLTHSTLLDLEPAAQYNEYEIFTFAWISDPERFDYEKAE